MARKLQAQLHPSQTIDYAPHPSLTQDQPQSVLNQSSLNQAVQQRQQKMNAHSRLAQRHLLQSQTHSSMK